MRIKSKKKYGETKKAENVNNVSLGTLNQKERSN